MIVYEHSVPGVIVFFAVVLALAAGAYSFWRFMPRNRWNYMIAGLYALFVLLLAWCVLLPGLRTAETRILKPRFAVLLDTSGSMLLAPSKDVSNRWERARAALDMEWTSVLTAESEVDAYAFASEISDRMSLAALRSNEVSGTSTLLRDTLKKTESRYAGLNLAGALLLSDGADTREAFDDWAGDVRPFPVYCVRLEEEGEWEEEPDLRIDSVNTPRRVTVEWLSELRTVISGQGTRGRPVTLQLFENGVLKDEKPTVIPAEGGVREARFELEHPEVGVFSYRIFAPPLPGETSTNDNEYVVSVQVIDVKNRLLYVEGTPRWEYKFLRRAMLANREATPVIFYTGPDGRPRGGVAVGSMTADMTGAQLAFFKIVVLGDLDMEELSERRAKNLVQFVENGGSLVLLGGTKAWGQNGVFKSSLRKVLPIKALTPLPMRAETPFDVVLTDLGRSHAAFAGDMELWDVVPPVLSVFPGAALSPGAQVLVSVETPGREEPMVVAHRYGQGKVVTILTDTLWKWQLTEDSVESRPYRRFWSQLISWLLPAEEEIDKDEIDLFADRDSVFLGEELTISARMGEEEIEGGNMQCVLALPDQRKIPYAMASQLVTTPSGRTYPGFVLKFSADQPGIHSAVAVLRREGREMVSDPISFFVRPFTPESVPGPIRAEVLGAIAKNSGGILFRSLEEMDEHLSGLNLNPIEEEMAEYKTRWRTWFLVVLMMLILSGTWACRKMRNMP